MCLMSHLKYSNSFLDESKLKTIKGLVQTNRNDKQFSLKATNDIREELAQLAQANGWLILSMQLAENSLEDVFQSLTK